MKKTITLSNGVCVVFLDEYRQIAVTSYKQNTIRRDNITADITSIINWKGASVLYRHRENNFGEEDHRYIKAFLEFGFAGDFGISSDPIKDACLKAIETNAVLMGMMEGQLLCSSFYVTASVLPLHTGGVSVDLYIPSTSKEIIADLYSEFGKTNCQTMEFIFKESLMGKPEPITKISVIWKPETANWIKRHIK